MRPSTTATSDDGVREVRVRWDIAPVAFLKIGAALACGWLIIKALPVVTMVLLSLMLVAAFNPFIRRLQAQQVTRPWGVSLIAVALVLGIAAILLILIPGIVRETLLLVTHLPIYLTALEKRARSVGLHVNLHTRFSKWAQDPSVLAPSAVNMVLTLFDGFTGLITTLVLTLYFLTEGPRAATAALRLLPRERRMAARQMFGQIGNQIGNYIRGQIITSSVIAVYSIAVLYMLKVPEPLALGILAGVSDAVPLVGVFIGTIPAVLLALTVSWTSAILILVLYVAYQQFENHLLVPRVYSSALGLSGSMILVAILLGSTLMGVLGAVLALPVAAAIPAIAQFVQEFQGDEDAPCC